MINIKCPNKNLLLFVFCFFAKMLARIIAPKCSAFSNIFFFFFKQIKKLGGRFLKNKLSDECQIKSDLQKCTTNLVLLVKKDDLSKPSIQQSWMNFNLS